MNAALRKEIRLLLPAWIVALAASTLPVWLVGQGDLLNSYSNVPNMPLYLFAAGALLLSLSSFGLEMSFGTFPSLLAQPRPRLETWQMKIGLLALALASVVVAAGFFWWLRVHTMLTELVPIGHGMFLGAHYPGLLSDVHIRCLPLLAVVASAGGLWTTLLLRQTVAAFWFAILVPLLLFGAFWPLVERLNEAGDNSIAIAALALVFGGYAAVGYFLARWLFLHAQDTQAHVATDAAAWSFRRRGARWTILPAFTRPRWPVMALLVKELRLQQGTLLIAAVLLVLELAAVAAHEFIPGPVASGRPLTQLYALFSRMGSESSFFHGIRMTWWVMPLLVGCASIAEERRGHTLESALCLPVGRLGQFVIKLLVVFGLGIFLGAVMPWMLEMLRPAMELKKLAVIPFIDHVNLPGLVISAAILTGIGCYASSLSGTLLQALGAAIGLYVMSLLVVPLFDWDRWTLDELRRFGVWLWGVRASWPFLLIVTCFCLSYANFKQLRITWRQRLGNGIIWLAVVFATPMVYFVFFFILGVIYRLIQPAPSYLFW